MYLVKLILEVTQSEHQALCCPEDHNKAPKHVHKRDEEKESMTVDGQRLVIIHGIGLIEVWDECAAKFCEANVCSKLYWACKCEVEFHWQVVTIPILLEGHEAPEQNVLQQSTDCDLGNEKGIPHGVAHKPRQGSAEAIDEARSHLEQA